MTGDFHISETVADSSRACVRALAAAGVEDARTEARRLLSAALGWSSADLLARSEQMLSPEQMHRIAEFLVRRCRREPLSRIGGEREFYGRPFRVTPATLDPRPDTETLIEAALTLLSEEQRDGPMRILDIGTGTGCLLLTLLHELPGAQGVGTDASADALAVARDNAARHGLQDRVSWTRTDLAEGVSEPFDIVVSNPPYVRTADIAQLPEEVRAYDPHLALDGGSDGLSFYRRIVADAGRLVRDGWLLLEVGFDQADAVAAMLAPQWEPRVFLDVAGIHRVVAARTRSS